MAVVMSLAILYEHPEWFQLLFAELRHRGIPFEEIHADQLMFDPETRAFPDLVVDRMSPSAWKRGHANGIFTVRDYLGHLEENGVSVVNGTPAYNVEISKSRQLDLFRKLGVGYPRARVINHASRAVRGCPGAAVPGGGETQHRRERRRNCAFRFTERTGACRTRSRHRLDGPGAGVSAGTKRSHRASRGGAGREFLYAIQIFPDTSSFNLCPADICRREDIPLPPQTDFSVCPVEAPVKKQLRIERVDPPREAIEGALALARAAKLDVGGIEYLVNDRDGRICYYDINALSNFVSDAVNVLGFDPTARFVDYLERRLAAVTSAPVPA